MSCVKDGINPVQRVAFELRRRLEHALFEAGETNGIPSWRFVIQ